MREKEVVGLASNKSTLFVYYIYGVWVRLSLAELEALNATCEIIFMNFINKRNINIRIYSSFYSSTQFCFFDGLPKANLLRMESYLVTNSDTDRHSFTSLKNIFFVCSYQGIYSMKE